MKLSVVIPAYNEQATIRQVVDNVKMIDIDKEIIIVDDGSTDGTGDIIKRVKSEKNNQVRAVHHPKNKGKGAAIRTGIRFASGDIILIQDADSEYDPNDYYKLVKPILEGKAAVVYGSRRLNKSNKQYSGLQYYLGGLFLTLLTNMLYGTSITDEPTCYKVFKKEVIKNMKLRCERFEFCPEVTAKIAKKKIKIYEVPISYHPRHKKEGKKIDFGDFIEAIWTLVKYRFLK